MNDSQTIFTLVFAISWGIASNVLPRWKPFHYALCFHCAFWKPTNRMFASWALLNILPWCLFGVVLVCLHSKPNQICKWDYCATLCLVVRSFFPGIIPFGAYHLWLTTMHCFPTCFYAETQQKVPLPFRNTCQKNLKSDIEPDATSLGLMFTGRDKCRVAFWNGFFGFVYIAGGMLVAHYV